MRELTPTQIELLELIADGNSLSESALLMHITMNTARDYSKNIYDKLGAIGMAHAVAIAYQQGILKVGVAVI